MRRRIAPWLVAVAVVGAPLGASYAAACAVPALHRCCCGDGDASCGCATHQHRPAPPSPATPAGAPLLHHEALPVSLPPAPAVALSLGVMPASALAALSAPSRDACLSHCTFRC